MCHKELTLHKLLPSARFCGLVIYIMESRLWRFVPQLLLCSTGLRTLCAVLGAGLVTACNTLGIQSTTDDVVTHTGEVLNTTATDQHDGVLLQVMADTGNVRGDLNTIREANTQPYAEQS